MIDELIQQELYAEALLLLEKEPTEEANYYRLVCFYALERYDDACLAGEKAMQEAGKRYYEVVALYLAALMAAEQNEKAIQLVDTELSVPYIPARYEDTFLQIKRQLLQKTKQLKEGTSPYDLLRDDELIKLLDSEESADSLLIVIAQLQRRNIRTFFSPIRNFLAKKEKPRYLKTILYELLANQGVQETFVMITTDGQTYEIIPSQLPPSMDIEFQTDLLNRIEALDSERSSMISDYVEQLLALYLAEQYPVDIAPEETPYLVGAIYAAALTLLNIEVEFSSISTQLELKEEFLFIYYEQILSLTSI